MRIALCRLEWVPADLWIGIFFRRTYSPDPVLNIWICLVPCVPLHVRMEWR